MQVITNSKKSKTLKEISNNMVKQLSNLKFSQDEIIKLFMNSPIGIYIITGKKFSYCNPKFQEITGYLEDELLNINPQDLIFTEDRTYVREKALKMLKRSDANPYEFRFYDKSGNVRWVVETIASIEYRGQRSILGNFMDTSEVRKKKSEKFSAALAESFKGITESMSELAESRDPYTAGHSRHVADLAAMIGREMCLSLEDIQGLRTCAILHDIGKSIIPAAILNKPGKLSEHEWGLISAHPATAYEALLHIPFPWPVADVVHQHHERLDGSGYPSGLKGSQIHPWARIIAVADVVDAVTSHRPYRPGMPRQNAIDELVKGRGRIYDPPAVDTLLKILSFGDKRVLVVDEDLQIMDALVEELRSDGLEAEGFTKPGLALEAFSQKPFPLVITELNMIAMDGAELTRQVKKISHLTEIIVITKYGSKQDTLKSLRAGATDFLEKPIDLGIFMKSVNRALQRYTGKCWSYKG